MIKDGEGGKDSGGWVFRRFMPRSHSRIAASPSYLEYFRTVRSRHMLEGWLTSSSTLALT
jgi:hypothetical protein